MIVRTNPNIDIPHPIHATIERACGLALACNTSNNKEKFVKWSNSQAR